MSRLESVDTQRLRWFVAVAEELHFARAAKSLNIARQTLSRAVIELASELGYELFVPGASPTRLTPDGHAALIEARRLLGEHAERAAEQCRAGRAAAIATAARVLRIGFVPGVTVSKWSRIWEQRFPHIPLDLRAIRADDTDIALSEGNVDMAFIRPPFDRDGMSAIPLYREVPVVVAPKEHLVAAFDEVTLSDLADEQLHDVNVDTVSSTMELVAAGVGLIIVPHSVARLHARRDLVYRTVTDAPDTEIVLAWPTDMTTDLVEEFIGIVRGRSERSSRTTTNRSEPGKKNRREARKPATRRGKTTR